MTTRVACAVLLGLFLSSCADPISVAPSLPPTGAPLAARPTQEIPIAFTVSDAAPNRIRSDGLGEYVDGPSVSAVLDHVGNLQITGITRRVVFDYSGAQVTGAAYTPDTTGMQGMRIVSQNNVTPSVPRMQDMTVGSTACYGLTIPYTNGAQQQVRHLYHGYQEAPQTSSSVHVFVTRTSATTWSVTSSGPCPVNSDWAGVWTIDNVKKAQFVFRGYFNLPFSMTFRTL